MDFRRLKEQFTKYALIGIFNFGISWGVLNLLLWITNRRGVIAYTIFLSIGFICAVSNSYLWNRNWTFKSQKGGANTYSLFFVLTLIGAIIGIGISSVIYKYVPPVMGLGLTAWANVGLFVSVAFQIIWNFTVYSQIVFRSPVTQTEEAVRATH
ncbi:MAG TPA: GtrA family protein [Blastocatellia bacterium]|nr:GtrA family protein [Blastocatellia bacterium]